MYAYGRHCASGLRHQSLCLHAVKLYSTKANLNGVFAVNKPPGPSSAVIVGQIKRTVNKSKLVAGSKANGPSRDDSRHSGSGWKAKKQQQGLKVGHGGTLDPLASGVMIIGVGTGTRDLTHYLTNCTKVYEAVAMFGVSTTTYDSEGKILEHGPTAHLTVAALQKAIDDKFTGLILQLPPIYSALKMDGKPLYEYARQGIPLPKQIEPRKVNVDYFEIVEKELDWAQTEYGLPKDGEADPEERAFIAGQSQQILDQVNTADLSLLTSKPVPSSSSPSPLPMDENAAPQPSKQYPTLTFRFSVSSGTYIRSLIHDLAKAVGSTAHMTKLTRVQQGQFKLGHNVIEVSDIVSITDGLLETEWTSLVETAIAQGGKFDLEAAKKRFVQDS